MPAIPATTKNTGMLGCAGHLPTKMAPITSMAIGTDINTKSRTENPTVLNTMCKAFFRQLQWIPLRPSESSLFTKME